MNDVSCKPNLAPWLSGKLQPNQAGSLDDSLQTITTLESAVEGCGKDTVSSKEQNEGREKLQVGDTDAELQRQVQMAQNSAIEYRLPEHCSLGACSQGKLQ